MRCFGRRTSRGFTLVEVIGSLIVLGAFALVASHLSESCWRTMRASAAVRTSADRFDAATAQMREDAWGAAEMSAHPSGVTLARPEGRIEWRIGKEGALVRTSADGSEQSWPIAAQELKLGVDGPFVVLTATDGAGRSQVMRLVSQVRLDGEARP